MKEKQKFLEVLKSDGRAYYCLSFSIVYKILSISMINEL